MRARRCHKARRLGPGRHQTSLCGRIVPETEVLNVCKWHRAGQGSHGREVRRVRGSEDLAVECLNFTAFLIQRATIPHKNKECLYNPLPHVSHFSFNQECFPAVVQTTVRGNAAPEPSDLTCISISYQFKCQKHMFPLCLPSDSQTYILLWFPQRRKRLNVLGGPVLKQHTHSQGSKHSAGPVGAADRQVGMDGISWKGPKGETIQLTSAQSQ